MTTRSRALLERLGLRRVELRREARPVARATDRVHAVASPRRVWLFGLELRPKTLPLRRLG